MRLSAAALMRVVRPLAVLACCACLLSCPSCFGPRKTPEKIIDQYVNLLAVMQHMTVDQGIEALNKFKQEHLKYTIAGNAEEEIQKLNLIKEDYERALREINTGHWPIVEGILAKIAAYENVNTGFLCGLICLKQIQKMLVKKTVYEDVLQVALSMDSYRITDEQRAQANKIIREARKKIRHEKKMKRLERQSIKDHDKRRKVDEGGRIHKARGECCCMFFRAVSGRQKPIYKWYDVRKCNTTNRRGALIVAGCSSHTNCH